MLKINPEKTANENIVALLNTQSRRPIANDEFSFANPVVTTPAPENGNTNTSLVCTYVGASGLTGNTTVNYHRDTLSQNKPSGGSSFDITSEATMADVKQLICGSHSLRSDQVVISSPATPPVAGDSVTFKLNPIANSLLYAIGEMSVTVRNTDEVFDPYFNYVSLLVPGNGPNNSINFKDWSKYDTELTRGGDTIISNTQSKFGGTSIYLDGTGDFISIPSSPQMNFGSGDFTIEAWIRLTTNTVANVIMSNMTDGSATNSYYYFITTAAGLLQFQIRDGAGLQNLIGTTTIPINTWTHVAVTRSGNNIKLFVNGVLEGTLISSKVLTQRVTNIGRFFYNGSNLSYFNGYIADVRVTKGLSRYNDTFEVRDRAFPYKNFDQTFYTTSLQMAFDGVNNQKTSTFKDTGPYNITVSSNGAVKQGSESPTGPGSWALYMTTNASITIPAHNDFAFAGDFTIECFFNYVSNGANQDILGNLTGAAATDWKFLVTSGNVLQIYYVGSGSFINAGTISPNQWYHLALVRQGTTVKFYLNGVQTGATPTVSAAMGVNNKDIHVGSRSGTSAYMRGRIASIRITNGTALYTSDFFPPEEKLPAHADTKLLMLQTPQLQDEVMRNRAFTVTNSTSMELKMFGPFKATVDYNPDLHGGSCSISAAAQWLAGTNANIATGTNDMYVELWFNVNSIPTSGAFFSTSDSTAGTSGIYLAILTSRVLRIQFGNDAGDGDRYDLSATADLVNYNIWHHLAVQRVGNVAHVWLNGVYKGNFALKASPVRTLTQQVFNVGKVYVNNDSQFFIRGKVSGITLLQGTGPRTPSVDFVPPTQAPTAVAGTKLLLNFTGAGGLIDQTGRNNIYSSGEAKINTVSPISGVGSLIVDSATNDYIVTEPAYSNFLDAALDWEIEFYTILGSVTANQTIFQSADNSGATTYAAGIQLTLRVASTGALQLLISTGAAAATTFASAASTLAADTLYHFSIAYTASTKSFVVYRNGVAFITANATAYAPGVMRPASFTLARTNPAVGTAELLKAKLDLFRVTMGRRRHGGEFTPVTDPYPLH